MWDVFRAEFMRDGAPGGEVLAAEHHAVDGRPGMVAAYAYCRGEGWQEWGAGIAGTPEAALAAAVAAAAARGIVMPGNS
ncbi:hypothetical protein [Dactylosporangium sp. CA-139066]|uniref:hypothetical protein n=1 Tax=Dactylosporangium sp. CA-139066 TaxID=3239930 RepID=UPI003D8CD868